MFLKKLELKGFKSFPEKIMLEFGKGITAVVGPNGSGKSNISDAVRWVLGEQSVKNLRGSNKMEDVIFVGTQNRTKLGFAEVSITIDNSDFKLNLDYNDVVITRRLFRSGESEFLINGSQCRLKNIHELFMDTGVGREGYSIIGQGRIDEILSSKSEDKRVLFEEAAGIVKFKTRRIEAEKNLEKEKQNLIRIDDIINEIENQLSPLKIQAEKTKKYLSLNEKLKIIQVNLFIIELKKIEDNIVKINENRQNSEKELENEEKKYDELKNTKTKIDYDVSILEKDIKNINNEIAEFRSLFEQKENDIKLINQQIEYVKKDIDRIKNDTIKHDESIKNKNNAIEIKKTEKQANILNLDIKNKNFSNIKSEFEFMDFELSKKEEQIDKFNNDIIEKIRMTGKVNADYEKATTNVSQLLIRKNKLTEEFNFSKSQINDKKVHFEALKIKLNKNNDKQNEIKNNLSNLEKQKIDIENKIILKTNEKNKIQSELQEASSKFRVLSELEKDFEGYYGSVKSILKEKEKSNPIFNGIYGAVGELISVKEEYETAIEIALGSSLQNIVTQNENDAKKAIEYLKNNKKGRATFLPMTAIKSRDIGNAENYIIKEHGIVGIAKQLISYDKKFENIMSNLLGKVIISSDLQSAIDFSKKYSYFYKVVTISGEVINIGGSLTGGSINRKSTGIFSRVREIKNLRKRIDDLKNDLNKIDKEFSNANEENINITKSIEKQKSEINNLLIEKNNIQNKINQTEDYIKDFYEKSNTINSEIDKISSEINHFECSAKNLKEQKDKLENQINEIKENLEGFQDEIQSEKNTRDKRNIELTQLQIEITEIEHSITSADMEINRLNSEIKELKDTKEKLLLDISYYKNDIEIKQNKILNLKNDIDNDRKIYNTKNNIMNSLNNKKSDILKKSDNIQKQCIDCLNFISNIKAENERLSIFLKQEEDKKTRLCNEIWEKYEITEASAQNFQKLDYSLNKMQIEEIRIRGQIKDMGNVNTNAINEYITLKERFDFLTAQKLDIVQAEENLKNIISELTELMENQFKEQFDIINKNFGEVFSEIFGGGKGYISLLDENDVLNSGINISAQPPGKAVQNMTLLSGGERALTAIALLFAILKMKPSPFCILDEIEAALDDANVKRYANYLKDFSNETQFIIITHRKGSMEVADTLYGVTMQEQGVSKLISVKLEDNIA